MAELENERMSLREYQNNCQGYLPGAIRLWVEDLEREKAELEERVEQLEDGLRDVLDVVEGWCRPMSDEERLPAIKEFASQALSGPKKEGDG